MKKFKYYLKRIYRIALSYQKQEDTVWTDLKKLHAAAKWKSGVYEKEKYIEAIYEISEEQGAVFYYMIYDGCYHCRVKTVEEYPIDLTTDVFILATHFNNILTNGVVLVNVNSRYVEYHQKRDLLVPLLYNSEIHTQLMQHYNTSKDIYSAFQRLVIEQEAPAIIIADLIKNKAETDDEDKLI